MQCICLNVVIVSSFLGTGLKPYVRQDSFSPQDSEMAVLKDGLTYVLSSVTNVFLSHNNNITEGWLSYKHSTMSPGSLLLEHEGRVVQPVLRAISL
jgi:hypothetical protein